MVFKKSLNPFQRYSLETQLECWDKKFFYFSQKFKVGDELMASASVRACFKKRGVKGIRPTSEIFKFLNLEDTAQELSLVAKNQIKLDLLLVPRQ